MDDEVKRAPRDRLTVSVETAGTARGLSRSPAYAAVRAGQIPSIKIGGRILVPTARLRKMLGIDGD
jgi:hypothetical protein